MWKTSDKVEFNGNNTPYSAAGSCYLRTADEDREVTPEELKNFFVSNEYKEKWERAASSSIIKDVAVEADNTCNNGGHNDDVCDWVMIKYVDNFHP